VTGADKPSSVEPGALRERFDRELAAARDAKALTGLRNAWLAKKGGLVTEALARLKEVPAERKREVGQEVNDLKRHVESALELRGAEVREHDTARVLAAEALDPTLPGLPPDRGGLHPIRLLQDEIEEIFASLGYSVATGPEVEDDRHNFELLNIPADHPARDAHDTFYLRSKAPGTWLLRTHTSPVQVRTMAAQEPPLRIICPGKVYRRDDDASHSPLFHQFEGLVVDEGVSFADLKGTIEVLFKRLLGPQMTVRLRPSYFPFTEPSAEVDISCALCGSRGCPACKHSGWIEVMGAGMVHPSVFEAVGYDSEKWTGFAFGGGIDRMAMLKYGVPNIGLLFENDVRFLRQRP
jgi:phenylalanyl-tRNA synthetase alpha chain